MQKTSIHRHIENLETGVLRTYGATLAIQRGDKVPLYFIHHLFKDAANADSEEIFFSERFNTLAEKRFSAYLATSRDCASARAITTMQAAHHGQDPDTLQLKHLSDHLELILRANNLNARLTPTPERNAALAQARNFDAYRNIEPSDIDAQAQAALMRLAQSRCDLASQLVDNARFHIAHAHALPKKEDAAPVLLLDALNTLARAATSLKQARHNIAPLAHIARAPALQA